MARAPAPPAAHHLIDALETFIVTDPPGVFQLIAQSVKHSKQGGYGIEQMAAALVVGIVERDLTDYRSVFADPPAYKNSSIA